MRLHEGDKIEITDGLPLKAGVYWVEYVSYCHGQPYYGLRKLYSRGIDGRFFTNTIDALMAQGVLVAA
jgi:hypothetical protein